MSDNSQIPERRWARRIVEVVGAHGIPPEWGFQYFSTGIEPWLKVIENDYLKTYVSEDGGAAFKLVVGAYGGGKTHFLYNVREVAWNQNFAVSYVPLSKDETPFHKMELVYASVARNLTGPKKGDELLDGYSKGLGALLEDWTRDLIRQVKEQGGEPHEGIAAVLDGVLNGVENVNFSRALRVGVMALATGDLSTWEHMKGWLTGQGFDRMTYRDHGILRGIDRSNAFSMFRSLVQFLRAAGFTGLVVLFDEAEVLPSMNSRDKQHLLANLRELIDSCGHNQFKNVMFFYAVPDYSFFEGKLNVYEALRQRLTSIFDFDNPTGVAIELERTVGQPEELLLQIGAKLLNVYNAAYAVNLTVDELSPWLSRLSREAYRRRGGDIGYKRLFVKGVIRLFHAARAEVLPDPDGDELVKYLSGGGLG